MIVDVVGVKAQKGVSKKSGNPYDMIIVAYTRDASKMGFTGKSAGELWCSRDLFPDRLPEVGDKLMIDRNGNYVEAVEFVY